MEVPSSSSSSVITTSSSAGADAGALDQPHDVFCQGSGSVGTFGAQATCSGDLAEETFRFALCACENIVVNAQLLVDAFDSQVGPYAALNPDGGLNIRDDGHLGMNLGPMLLTNKLTLRGSAYISNGGIQLGSASVITGNLYSYGSTEQIPKSDGVIQRNAFIHGNLGSAYAVLGDLTVPPGASVFGPVSGSTTYREFPDTVPCPCNPEEILDVAGLTQWAANHNDNALIDGFDGTAWATGEGPGTVTLPCGRYYITSIYVPQQFDLTVTGRVVMFVDGDLNTGGISITVEPGAELDLFVRGDLIINSSASFGSAEQPSLVRTYVGGNLGLQASATFAGNIYAPYAIVEFSGATNVYGALIVRQVNFQSNSQVHYDSAIRRAGDACDALRNAGASNPPDASVNGDDGGSSSNPDGGMGDGDGGSSGTTDGGSGSVDAGPTACLGVCDRYSCGDLACRPNGTEYACGPCESDLDCCAPDVCDTYSGICFPLY